MRDRPPIRIAQYFVFFHQPSGRRFFLTFSAYFQISNKIVRRTVGFQIEATGFSPPRGVYRRVSVPGWG